MLWIFETDFFYYQRLWYHLVVFPMWPNDHRPPNAWFHHDKLDVDSVEVSFHPSRVQTIYNHHCAVVDLGVSHFESLKVSANRFHLLLILIVVRKACFELGRKKSQLHKFRYFFFIRIVHVLFRSLEVAFQFRLKLLVHGRFRHGRFVRFLAVEKTSICFMVDNCCPCQVRFLLLYELFFVFLFHYALSLSS